MRLARLEVRDFRSIQDQTGSESIELGDLTCLVGANNSGKSNLLKCIRFLVRGERPNQSDHYDRDLAREVDVRGYFEVDDEDFERLKLGEKRAAFQQEILDDGTLGFCNRSSTKDLELMGYYPADERLDPDNYLAARDEIWGDKDGQADFRDRMMKRFPELVPFLTDGKETNKGEWKNAYDAMRAERPDEIEFELRPGPPPTGISADVNNFLPEILFVPAVKEVGEATKTSSTGELGALLKAVSEEIQGELDSAIEEAMAEVHRQLNVIRDEDSDERIDERHETVRSLEKRITGYVKETFPDHMVSLEFPNPESKMMFDNARVWIEEEDHGRVHAEDVGEGVKRILIFSLIRTLADLRHGRLGVGEEVADADEPNEPILLLYEESELFLHPGLQRILLETLATLSGSGDQVVYSTHSPFMIPDVAVGEVALVRKSTSAGTTTQDITTKLRNADPRDRNRLRQVQNLSSYVFSDRVVLVEGESDRIVLEKIASVLNSDWNFDVQGIRVLPVLGKGNLPIFRSFLTEIGVRTYVMVDLDAARRVIGDFQLGEECELIRGEFLNAVGDLAVELQEEANVNASAVRDHIRGLDWDEVVHHAENLHSRLSQDADPHPEGLEALRRLLDVRRASAQREALISDRREIAEARSRLQEVLLERDTLLMNARLEGYYPYPGGNKIAAALEFDADEMGVDELRDHMSELPNDDVGDLEKFLQQVFDS